MQVRIAEENFDPHAETAAFVAGRTNAGALVSFIGYCRDATTGQAVRELYLDHYGAFTQKEIVRLAQDVAANHDIIDGLVVHRVGAVKPGQAIVLVVMLGVHRGEAFDAARLLMDYLKTDAPLWKKETGPQGERWIEPNAEDYARRAQAERAKP